MREASATAHPGGASSPEPLLSTGAQTEWEDRSGPVASATGHPGGASSPEPLLSTGAQTELESRSGPVARVERRLDLGGPLDFAGTLSRFAISPDELVNRFEGDRYRRLLRSVDRRSVDRHSVDRRLPGGLFLLEAEAEDDGLSGRVRLVVRGRERPGRAALEGAERALRWVLGLQHDLEGFYKRARRDPLMARLVERFRGLRPASYLGLYEALTTAITAQQVNLRFAGSVRAALVRSFGEKMRLGGELHYAFPRPQRVARASPERLKGLRFSSPKAGYLVGLARAAAAGALSEERLARAPLEEALRELTALRGVGRWTAESALFRGLGRAEALPAGDLGVRKAVGRYYLAEKLPGEEEVRRWGKGWGPYAALAASYLLHASRAHGAEEDGG